MNHKLCRNVKSFKLNCGAIIFSDRFKICRNTLLLNNIAQRFAK